MEDTGAAARFLRSGNHLQGPTAASYRRDFHSPDLNVPNSQITTGDGDDFIVNGWIFPFPFLILLVAPAVSCVG